MTRGRLARRASRPRTGSHNNNHTGAMMKQANNKVTILAALAGLWALGARAGGSLVPATLQEMAKYNATHVLQWDAGDLTGTTTNATLAFTNTVTGPVALKFEGYLLDRGFDCTLVTNPVALTATVGNTSDTNLWINGLQIAQDQTPTTWASFGSEEMGPIEITQTGSVSIVTSFAATGPVYTMNDIRRGSLRTFWRLLGPDSD